MAFDVKSDDLKSIRDEIHKGWNESMWKIGHNYGDNNEYFCLSYSKFFYRPWWYPRGIEFRPFRNVRIYKNFGNENFQIIGYSRRFLDEPPFTIQSYRYGLACKDSINLTTTFVTYICGTEDRIVDFKIIRDCDFYELYFETPAKCGLDGNPKILNQLAIQKYGKEDFTYLYMFLFALVAFVVLSAFIRFVRRKRRK